MTHESVSRASNVDARQKSGASLEYLGRHLRKVGEYVADEPRAPISDRVEQRAVVEGDHHRRADRRHPPQAERQYPHRCARISEAGAQPLLLKPDVRMFVGDDPRSHHGPVASWASG